MWGLLKITKHCDSAQHGVHWVKQMLQEILSWSKLMVGDLGTFFNIFCNETGVVCTFVVLRVAALTWCLTVGHHLTALHPNTDPI